MAYTFRLRESPFRVSAFSAMSWGVSFQVCSGGENGDGRKVGPKNMLRLLYHSRCQLHNWVLYDIYIYMSIVLGYTIYHPCWELYYITRIFLNFFKGQGIPTHKPSFKPVFEYGKGVRPTQLLYLYKKAVPTGCWLHFFVFVGPWEFSKKPQLNWNGKISYLILVYAMFLPIHGTFFPYLTAYASCCRNLPSWKSGSCQVTKFPGDDFPGVIQLPSLGRSNKGNVW